MSLVVLFGTERKKDGLFNAKDTGYILWDLIQKDENRIAFVLSSHGYCLRYNLLIQ